MTRGARAALAGLVSLVLLAVVGVVLVRSGVVDVPWGEGCTATVEGRSVDLDLEQAENAGIIVGIAVARDLPARAASIALATAYQESDLRNLDHGDRDSLGLFQQRPSQGWGTAEQVQDPHFATNAFYDALVRIDGYQDLDLTVAAQEVQRSGFPDAYADHEDDARVLASALTGYSPEAFVCRVRGEPDDVDLTLTDSGLVPAADAVRTDLASVFGHLPLGGFAPGGVSSGHQEGSAHYEGRAIDVFFRPVNEENRRTGWAVAHYLVSQAARLGIRTVIFDDRIWTSGREEWRDYDPPERAGDPAILEHRDHVHLDVFG